MLGARRTCRTLNPDPSTDRVSERVLEFSITRVQLQEVGRAEGRADVRFAFGLDNDGTRNKLDAISKFNEIKDHSK